MFQRQSRYFIGWLVMSPGDYVCSRLGTCAAEGILVGTFSSSHILCAELLFY